MLLDFEQFLPKLLKDELENSPSGQAMVDFINGEIQGVLSELEEITWFKLIDRCPTKYLSEFGIWLSANILEYDSDYTKRYKIKTAIATHKVRGSWTNDAKNRIDTVTGYNAVIFSIQDSDDSIELGYEDSDPDFFWSTESAYEEEDGSLGTWEVGEMNEYVIAGNIYINCHKGIDTGVLTNDQVAQIIAEIETDVVPAYMSVFLGYVNTENQFILYDSIE